MEQLALITRRRDHVAIMRPSLGLLEKIVIGEKTIESRWYLQRSAPWDEISAGDTIYFKNAGEPISIRADVAEIQQFDRLNSLKIRQILDEFGLRLGYSRSELADYFSQIKDKKYCIIIFLQNILKVKLFDINKKGFGTMSAWLVVDNIDKIKKVKQPVFKQNKLLR
ncbi:MAG TPA: hypothetical protein VJK08_03135 [Patescibacteria group bacterium]|nr:hypothetical protein [Patescibacteria group bacterium]